VQDLAFFERHLGSKSVSTDEETLEIHNTDWTKKYQGTSSLMLKPKTTAEVSAILSYCNERKLAVVP
jgi:FAD/FMN-containing dehydrogenase